MNRREKTLRWSFFIIGLVILGLGISLTIKGQQLGIGPWDVLHVGLFQQLGLTVGTWAILVGALIIALTVVVTKKPPRIGAILNMLLIGVFIDFFNWLIPEPQSLIGAIVILLAGIVVMGYGVGIYVSADLGEGPRDTIMMMIVRRTGWNLSKVRRSIEIVALIIGWLLGGPVGIGTILIAFFTGTIVNLSLPQSRIALQKLLTKEAKTAAHHA
ncbi:YczE/YyaS/YitT family protein [Jeotgalibacillus haloalkalitolerans]|uniref:YitT family protein n=1 Tax=Jeotgalibacillus haloalkalitolerans TaxID=3104292 RepID=A0ABU5KIQ1_9BACL|nr:YitT family protein [Jeotgalibacillus sp. HH7-29]MDZ5711129.1 YitT family protein [Jeotgalibacillus sp. HH7-29]